MKDLFYVLLLDSNDADAFVIRYILKSEFNGCDITTVKGPVDFFYSLQHIHFDLIIADFLHPTLNNVHALEVAKIKAKYTPVICVSHPVSKELIDDAMGRGAVEYVFKTELHKLPDVVDRILDTPVQKPPHTLNLEQDDELNTFLF